MSKKITIIVIVLLVAVAISFYAFFDPQKYSFFPKCLFYSITGLKCPGCGSQRAIHQLLNGNISAAFHYNAMMVSAIPYLALGFVLEYYKPGNAFLNRLRLVLYHGRAVWAVAILILTFWLLRDIYPDFL
jgi:hypothetical protein